MTEYPHDKVVPFSDSEAGKKEQVAEMFDKIAFRYDMVNTTLSGGIDRRWRKRAIRLLAAASPREILDVATGTAEMAILMSGILSRPVAAGPAGPTQVAPPSQASAGIPNSTPLTPVHITGIDISDGMLAIGKQKIARLHLEDRIRLLTGDSESIPFPDAQFDAVTVAFGVRNFGNLEKGLAEMLRVLRPGGQLIVLEFSKPRTWVFRQLYEVYMRLIASPVGRLLSRNGRAYRYLNDSVRAFPEGQRFLAILDKAGYVGTEMRPLTLGICTIYRGAKIPL